MDQKDKQIEELKLQIEDLTKRLYEANEANTAKETFLANMSHDIRTPMNAIVGMTSLAKKYIDEKPRVIDALNKIDAASTHLLSLINDILDMSRINSGKMEISMDEFSLPELINETYNIIRPQLEQKGHSWNLEADSLETEDYFGDPLRIRQVLVNILSNSVKYTQAGGDISLSVREDAADGGSRILSFVCTDNGIGMSEDFVERIFEPFERVNNSTISGIEGTGLGMSIVKKIVDAMNGTIVIKSKEGEGTEVTVALPLKPVPEEPSADLLYGKRILVIEANEKYRRKFSAVFEEAGIDYRLTYSASEAISAITDSAFEGRKYSLLVIGDERKDTGSLFELASYITKSYPDMALVLVSSAKWEDIEYRAERNGLRHFIPVPFFRNSLIKGLSKALESEGGSASDPGLPDLEGKTLLLAEDNMVNREIAKEILSATKAVIDCAENGQEAVDKFSASPEGHYALIFMDIQMPVMDGYEASRRIRALDRKDSNLPIYAMTANTFAEDIAKAKEAGMNGHVAKPIDINVLMQTLKKALL